MKLISLLLEGSLKDPVTYNFGSLYPVTQGEWELCLKTVAIFYEKAQPPSVDPPNINRFIRVSCNYVQSLYFVDESHTQSMVGESVLSLNRLKLKAGQKEIFHFNENNFFVVSEPTQTFEISSANSDGSSLPKEMADFLKVSVLIFFRRKS